MRREITQLDGYIPSLLDSEVGHTDSLSSYIAVDGVLIFDNGGELNIYEPENVKIKNGDCDLAAAWDDADLTPTELLPVPNEVAGAQESAIMPIVTKREAARRDLGEHFIYLAENAGLGVADEFLRSAEASFTELARQPQMGAC